jgi:hypothetical protein
MSPAAYCMLGLPSFSRMTAKSMSFALAGTVLKGISVAIDIAAIASGFRNLFRAVAAAAIAAILRS